MKKFTIFAGPNGSGKSSLIQFLLDDPESLYLNADIVAKTAPCIQSLPDGIEKDRQAWILTNELIDIFLDKGVSLSWETVFSNELRFVYLEKAKQLGYTLELFYITTNNPEINKKRVKKRVSEGGHDVDEEKIVNRYDRSVGFLPRIIIMADEATIIDNSYDDSDPQHSFHEKAKGLFEDLFGYDEIWITDAILFELGDGLSKYRRDTVVDFIKSCFHSKQFHVVDTNQTLLMRALDRFATFKDKDWSLTDCLSFEVMATNDISIAYSSDHHFGQAGFQYLLQ